MSHTISVPWVVICMVVIALGPGRREMERMEKFKNQAEDQPASRSSANPPFGGLGGIGMMRLPGRVRSGGDPEALGLPLPGRGRVSDERIEVSLLGDLAGLSISNENVGGFDVSGWERRIGVEGRERGGGPK